MKTTKSATACDEAGADAEDGAARDGRLCATASCAVAALDACEAFLRGLDGGVYARACAVMHGGTIGQHVRHALDHYAAALAGGRGEVIDYDRRERGTSIETEVGAALSLLGEIRGGLRAIDAERAETAVRVRVMVNGATGEEAEHGSTLGREVAFAAHHAVHHHAMMAAIAKSMGVIVPAGFEKAPSTVRHERARAG
ncbi:MAG: hypothetical protein ACKVZJ_04175 [Phycisphaerales bacterium]